METYSVLMSVYAKEDPNYLAAAMDSMFTQTVAPSDFVLVCDGPLTADLNRVIASFQKRYGDILNVIRLEKNCGLGSALKVGVPVCKSALVARMDSDDISVKNRMELLLPEMIKDPLLGAVGGQIAEFQGAIKNIVAERKVPLGNEDIKQRMKSRNPMNHVTTLLRKEAVIQVGNYNNLKGFEDYYLWAQLLSSGYHLKNIDVVCCYVRVGENMYRRRGGAQYFNSVLRMEKHLKKTGIIGTSQYVANIVMRICVAGVPNCLRKFLYMHFLRRTIRGDGKI